jgi:hypothetical protein
MGLETGKRVSPKSWAVNGKKTRKKNKEKAGSRESRGGKKVVTPQGASRES